MTSPRPKAIERWEKQRAKGRTRYILQIGVFGWGLAMFIAMTFVVNRPVQLTPSTIALSAIIWLLGGALFGFVTWTMSERKYRKHMNAQSPSSKHRPN